MPYDVLDQTLGMGLIGFARRDHAKALRPSSGSEYTGVSTAAKCLEKLEQGIGQHVQAHDALQRESRCLQTILGIGPMLSAALIAYLPELGHMDRREIAALSGLAPHARDSGLFKGKRRIWGGRANVRRTLYLAAFIASRYDPTLRSFRKRLEVAGKPTKVAIVATARKLVTILNAMMKNNCDYRKTRLN